MLYAYLPQGGGLHRLDTEKPSLADPGGAIRLPSDAMWIDLFRPLAAQQQAIAALGIAVPSLRDMEEIEPSNRIYRENGAEYLTAVVPGRDPDGAVVSGPVTFVLTETRIVTVRHHLPRAFETYPARAERGHDTGPDGCTSPDRIFLGLTSEIVGTLADALEEAGRILDNAGRRVFSGAAANRPELLQKTLEELGAQGERLGRVRASTSSLERALNHFLTMHDSGGTGAIVATQLRDLAALAVQAEFLAGRLGLMVDATLGMINLAQNATVRIVSVVAVLFLPPTLVASAYGMNFDRMPGLHAPAGYPLALILMLLSALGTYLVFKWKDWL